MSKFLIVRLSSLGDIIHTLPAFSALRKHFPDAKISWLVEEKGKDILELVPGINKIIVTPLKSARIFSKKFIQDISRLKRQLKSSEQTSIDFQGLIKSGFFSWFSGAKPRLGFQKINCREPQASWFYTDKAAPFSEDEHVIRKNLHLLSLLKIKEELLDFPFLIPEELSQTVRDKLSDLGATQDKKFVLLNLGAAWETKRLPSDKWVQLIKHLEKLSIHLLLLWGTQAELELAEKVRSQTNTILLPYLSLKEVFALIQEAALVVTGDSFALQAACALSRPTVSFFGPTNPERNGPFHPDDCVVFHRLECSYCYKRTCDRLECIQKISPEEIADLCLKRLNVS